jgi:multidrug resistance efflux pump
MIVAERTIHPSNGVTHAPPLTASPSRHGGRLVRAGILGLVFAGSLALGVVAWRWAQYRHDNIVSHEGWIKGAVSLVGARMDGQVESILVQPGQFVSKGDVLARLENDYLESGVELARAELEKALRQLSAERADIEISRQQLTVQVARADANLDVALADFEAAKYELDRWEKEHARVLQLSPKRAITSSDADQVTANRGSAQAALAAAAARRTAAERGCQSARIDLDGLKVRELRLKVLESQVETARSEIAIAEANRAASVICAPDDGYIIQHIAQPGSSVRVGDQIVSMLTGRQLWAEAWIEETDLKDVEIGAPAEVILKAHGHKVVSGRIDSIGVLTDCELADTLRILPPQALGQFFQKRSKVPVCIAFDAEGLKLMPGLSVVVGIERRGE